MIREVKAVKDIIEDSPPVLVVNQECSIVISRIEFLVCVCKRAHVILYLLLIDLNFITSIAPFPSPFTLAVRIPDPDKPMSFPWVDHLGVRNFKGVHDPIRVPHKNTCPLTI